MSWSLLILVDHLVDRPVDRPVDHLVDHLVDCPVLMVNAQLSFLHGLSALYHIRNYTYKSHHNNLLTLT